MRLFVLTLLAACSSKPDADAITWYGDVEPVARQVCGNCHNGSGVGPGDFSTFEGIYERLDLVHRRLADGTMPPPVSDPACHEYEAHDKLHLSDADRQLMLDWIADGGPPGDPELSAGRFEPELAHLEGANVTLSIPPHTLAPDSEGNQYRCFVLDREFAQTEWITGFEMMPDNVAVVHHAILFVDTGGDPGEDYAAVGETSFDCMDPVLERDWQFLHGWAPGGLPTDFGTTLGLKVEPGDKLVLQMHYFADPDDDPVVDQSQYALRTTTTSVAEMYLLPGGVFDLRIPAGAAEHTETDTLSIDYPIQVGLHGVFPHMHRLGTRYHAEIERVDGSVECVIDGPFDFDHQTLYRFTEPIPLAEGDVVRGSCTWDNSADNPNQVFDPPQEIGWGERTQDEMCLFLTYVSIIGF